MPTSNPRGCETYYPPKPEPPYSQEHREKFWIEPSYSSSPSADEMVWVHFSSHFLKGEPFSKFLSLKDAEALGEGLLKVVKWWKEKEAAETSPVCPRKD